MAKKDKSKLPKKIAGVKLPKNLRKGVAGLDSPLAREILADMLIAAAGAAAAALVKHRPTGRQVADAAGATRDVVQSAAETVTETVADAARRVLPASVTGASDGSEDDDAETGRPDKKTYPHLAEPGAKGRKDKHRPKASKH